MAEYDQYDTDDDIFRPEGPAKKATQESSGCGCKALVILLVGAIGVSMLCCCGIGFAIYSAVPNIEENPQVAQENVQQLLGTELPEDYTPSIAVDMNVFSLLKAKGAIVELPDDKGMLAIVGMSGRLAKEADFIDEIRKTIESEAGSEDVEVISSETHEIEINGQKVNFTFVQSKSTPTEENERQVELRQVRAIIPGKDGSEVFFFYIVEESAWDEQKVLELIESIGGNVEGIDIKDVEKEVDAEANDDPKVDPVEEDEKVDEATSDEIDAPADEEPVSIN